MRRFPLPARARSRPERSSPSNRETAEDLTMRQVDCRNSAGPRPGVAAPPPVAPNGTFSPHAGRFPSYDAYYANRNAFYGGHGWNPAPYVYASRPSFGIWDAMFMWFMLDSLSNVAHAAWFHHHADDP